MWILLCDESPSQIIFTTGKVMKGKILPRHCAPLSIWTSALLIGVAAFEFMQICNTERTTFASWLTFSEIVAQQSMEIPSMNFLNKIA